MALLVFGNGFDKACGLESSFPEYLKSRYYSSTLEKCKDVIAYIKDNGAKYGDAMPTIDPWYNGFSKVTFWDIYFSKPHLIKMSEREIELWSDFETTLNSFIMGIKNSWNEWRNDILTSRWSDIVNYPSNEDMLFSLALRLYLAHRTEQEDIEKVSHKTLAALLLEDLKDYEKRFGEYIREQQAHKKDYLTNAEKWIKALRGGDTLEYLNTFNYSDLSSLLPSKAGLWHVNGDADTPIFGIDYDAEETGAYDPWYIFTKTYRRLELNGSKVCYPTNRSFRKVIVYGHSLNKQDYNYFFALFNRLKLNKERDEKNGYSIVFAFNEYGGRSIEDVKREKVDGVLRMMQAYNKQVLHAPDFRLMDILYCNNAIRFQPVSIR
ncbi:MAG: bacteriophage abortive infection AbiH family protein [Lachnospiraceae bacterium]|nr:bacteriophage abortive infection AbiH family protein [Lachnospiraceae bacterium]